MNPHDTDTSRGVFAGEFTTVQTGVVTSAPSHSKGDDTNHVVTVKPFTAESEVEAEVRVGMRGDAMIPREGSVVYLGWRVDGDVVVLGAKYPVDESPPTFEPGERVIGHPASDSHVRLNVDGGIEVVGANGNTVTLTADGAVEAASDGGSTITLTAGGAVEATSDGDSTITLAADGSISLNGSSVSVGSDGSVSLNDDGLVVNAGGAVTVAGGSTAPVTDATVETTTDADGHVTSVSLSLTRASDITIPSQ